MITGNSGWDIFPTHTRLEPMRANGLLAPLDHAALPGLAIWMRFRAPAWMRACLGGALHVERHGDCVQQVTASGAGTVGRPVESGTERAADDARRSGGHAGCVPKETRALVQRDGPGSASQGRALGDRTEAAAARVFERGSARPTGGGRRVGGAVVVYDRATGDRRGAAAGLRVSGGGLPILLRLRGDSTGKQAGRTGP